jgi:hypothetical protein
LSTRFHKGNGFQTCHPVEKFHVKKISTYGCAVVAVRAVWKHRFYLSRPVKELHAHNPQLDKRRIAMTGSVETSKGDTSRIKESEREREQASWTTGRTKRGVCGGGLENHGCVLCLEHNCPTSAGYRTPLRPSNKKKATGTKEKKSEDKREGTKRAV